MYGKQRQENESGPYPGNRPNGDSPRGSPFPLRLAEEARNGPLPKGQMMNNWPHSGWWNSKEEKARKMTMAELAYARKDCFETAQANPETEGKYMDELSVYAMEMQRRQESR